MNEIIVTDDNIKNMIYEIRGKFVMLDSDLAKLYECKNGTKEINQIVKRNVERFPNEFCFQLTKEEINDLCLRSQIVTLNKSNNYRGQHIKYLPYVFTEQGVSMLSALIKSEKAIKTSIAIMNAFVNMKNYFINNNLLEFKYMNAMLLEHDNRLNILESFVPDIKNFSNQIFYDGEVYDAYSLLLDIFNDSKDNIIIIDNYISKELLDVLCKINVNITIYTKNIDAILINKYKSQYKNINIKINNKFHDRFIIIDNKVLYHSGASFKDLGKKCFCINRIEDYDILEGLLNKLSIVNY